MNLAYYLGLSWAQGEFDCWALVRHFYQREHGIDLPLLLVNVNNARALARATRRNFQRFDRLQQPVHGCVVGMLWLNQTDAWLRHVGVYLNFAGDERLLHNVVGAGVLCQPLSELPRQNLKTEGFYRYRG